MKIIIKNIINENIDPEEKYVNGLSNIINIPYFYNLKVTDTPEHLWNRILSKVFKQEVTVSNNGIYDLNNNRIYVEYSDGYFSIHKFDSNNNRIYSKDSNGSWSKREFDSNNNIIYFEDSNGKIIDNRPSNPINENIDPEEKYVNGLSSIINPPYFYNLKVTDTPERLWNRILTKVFNQEVTVNLDYIYDSNNNRIYSEDSNGHWWKSEYDLNNNQIYYENSDGSWEKSEYDSNNNLIYRENSNGYWFKQEYDSNNNQIYLEDSDGNIIDRRSNNPINENIDPEEKYVNGLSNLINIPYFYNLRVTDTPERLWNRILSKVFNQEVSVDDNRIYDSYNNLIYNENSDGDWSKREFDSNNNKIYYENSDGYWWKKEYGLNNNVIYSEDSDGRIIDNRPINPINENIDPEEKYVNGLSNIINPPYFYNLKVTDTPEHLWDRILSKKYNQEVTVKNNYIYDSNDNEIYFENSDGDWLKREYDSNNNVIYFEDSSGFWSKQEFDSNNNQIYWEGSSGYWTKREYDSNNNEIYRENSDGTIRDNRPSNPINENIDPVEKYINGLSNIINPPYFYNLSVNEVPKELWNEIFYRLFKHVVIISDNKIYDENNNEIYYEDSDGYWVKREFDSNNNKIYYETSDGVIRDNRPSNPINENIDPKQKFLSLVVDNMVKQSKDNSFPFDSEKMSFNEYCKNLYGLTDDEIDYVYSKYRFLMGWDEWDRSLPYLKKII